MGVGGVVAREGGAVIRDLGTATEEVAQEGDVPNEA